ncbi:hypothetical protein CL614_00685 [archaeon]|nr:hypothetical protein [archaeon]|tara:strand:- start:48 stop:1049 length:1002 start_codon:yes stop_codon:yes gene_type:complete
MKRKVIKQGHNTLTITLPSKWVEKNTIVPGEEVEVNEQGRGLMVEKNGNGTGEISSINVDITGLPPALIWRYVSSAYRLGYDEIRVSGIEAGEKKIYSAFSYNTLDCLKDSTKTSIDKYPLSSMEAVSSCVNRLVGMELIEQKNKYCIIKDLSEITDKEFHNAIKRIFMLLNTEATDIGEGLDGQKEGLKAIHLIDTNLDRFEDYCFRVLNKKGYEDCKKTSIVYSLVFTLELLGDEFKKLAVHILENKKKSSSGIRKLYEVQKEQLNLFHKLFFDFDKELLIKLYRNDKAGTKLAADLHGKLSEDEIEWLHHFKKIGIYILSLAELTTDMQF